MNQTNNASKVIEYLLDEHSEFRKTDLGIIQQLFFQCEQELNSNHIPMRELSEFYHDFKERFLSHMQEEEEFLFPKILRLEASVLNPNLAPEIYKGSIKVYPPNLLHSSDDELSEMVIALVAKAEKLHTDIQSKTKLTNLIQALKDYRDKIHAHAHIESNILLPRGRALEAELKKRLTSSQS